MRNEEQTPKISLYEQTRQERIKENLERIQKLGLKELSLKLKPIQRTPRNNLSTPKLTTPLIPSGPVRRSSRLQNTTPVSYSEAAVSKKDGLLVNEVVVLREGPQPEVYTEEHEKLLGSTERSWTLFVDGCGSDGKRIYDPIKGKTCHQCRQKTMGYRTHCSKCNIVQGQFCGDCLYMRYGEHVLEANENPNWVCPVCRGICNCSLCRTAKGWAPTGSLYKKISRLGYKSVAHYLIQTHRLQSNIGKDSVNQVSARRSLPFKDNEASSKEFPQSNDNQSKPLMSEPVDEASNVLEIKPKEEMPRSGNSANHDHVTTPLPKPISSIDSQPQLESAFVVNRIENHPGLSRTETEDKTGQQLKVEEVKELDSGGEENNGSNSPLGSCLKVEQKRESILEQIQDDDAQFGEAMTETNSNAEQSYIEEVKKENELCIEDDKQAVNATVSGGSGNPKRRRRSAEADPGSIGARLRQRRRLGKDQEDVKLAETKEPTSNVKQQAAKNLSPGCEDSIGKRLRPRRKTT